MKTQCGAMDAQYEERTKTRAEETEAISKAWRFLSVWVDAWGLGGVGGGSVLCVKNGGTPRTPVDIFACGFFSPSSPT